MTEYFCCDRAEEANEDEKQISMNAIVMKVTRRMQMRLLPSDQPSKDSQVKSTKSILYCEAIENPRRIIRTDTVLPVLRGSIAFSQSGADYYFASAKR